MSILWWLCWSLAWPWF